MSADIDPKDPNTAILVERMKLSLLSTGSGVGIAAPQVGINRKIIWVQRFDKEGKPLEYFLNPVILWKSQLQNLDLKGFVNYRFQRPILQKQSYTVGIFGFER